MWNGALAMLTGSKDIRCASSLVHRPLPRVFTFTQEKKSDAIVNANEKKKTTKKNDDNNNSNNKNKNKNNKHIIISFPWKASCTWITKLAIDYDTPHLAQFCGDD